MKRSFKGEKKKKKEKIAASGREQENEFELEIFSHTSKRSKQHAILITFKFHTLGKKKGTGLQNLSHMFKTEIQSCEGKENEKSDSWLVN